MRDGFHKIIAGWPLMEGIDDLAARMRRLDVWLADNGPLHPDEEAAYRPLTDAVAARMKHWNDIKRKDS